MPPVVHTAVQAGHDAMEDWPGIHPLTHPGQESVCLHPPLIYSIENIRLILDVGVSHLSHLSDCFLKLLLYSGTTNKGAYK